MRDANSNADGAIDRFLQRMQRKSNSIDDPFEESKGKKSPPPIPETQVPKREAQTVEEELTLMIYKARGEDRSRFIALPENTHHVPLTELDRTKRYRAILSRTISENKPTYIATALSALTVCTLGYLTMSTAVSRAGEKEHYMMPAAGGVLEEQANKIAEKDKAFCEDALFDKGSDVSVREIETSKVDEMIERCFGKDTYSQTAGGIWVMKGQSRAKNPVWVKSVRKKNSTLSFFSPMSDISYTVTKGSESPKTSVHFEDDDELVLCDYDGKRKGSMSCYSKHNAVDLVPIDRTKDTAIYPVLPGRVVMAYKGRNAAENFIEVEHLQGDGSRILTRYHHIKQFSPDIEQLFKASTRSDEAYCTSDCPIVMPHIYGGKGIGTIGGTFGINLHMEASIDGNILDPEQLLPPPPIHIMEDKRQKIFFNERYEQSLNEIARTLDIRSDVLRRIRAREATEMGEVSTAKARGFMQIVRSARAAIVSQCNENESLSDFCHEFTWENIKTDPIINLWAGAYALKSNLEMCGGNYEKAVAAYNAGIGTVYSAIDKSRIYGGHWMDYMPRRTKGYVQGVMRKRIGGSNVLMAGI